MPFAKIPRNSFVQKLKIICRLGLHFPHDSANMKKLFTDKKAQATR